MWANSNTYAPWQTPTQAGGNPSFSGYGGTNSGANWLGQGEGIGAMDIFSTNYEKSVAPLGWWDFKGGKKRSSPDFYAPSYQGTMFTPQEGIPDWYTNSDPSDDWKGMSSTGSQANYAAINQAYGNQLYGQGPSSDQPGAARDLSAQQSNLYNMYGGAMGGYQPQSVGGQYGGYGSYGGYADSASQTRYNKPFVPTGY
jgi:hypothetical protein